MLYDWLRAIHIILVIAWMAGLLMLPRFMAYQLEASPGGELYAKMETAISSLRKIIMTPSLIGTWVLGLALIAVQWPAIMSQPWMWLKLASVLVLTGFHGWFVAEAKRIARGEGRVSAKLLRKLNEVPFVLAIIAVIAVVVQPFS